MSQTTHITWANHTASPWFGCTEVSPGCANCYARELTLNHKWAAWGDKAPRIVSKGFWQDVYRWNAAAEGAKERPRIFTSLMDPFDSMPAGIFRDGKPQDRVAVLANFFKRVMECQNLDWLLLTKRPEKIMPTIGEVTQLCARHFMECGNLGGWMMGWLDGVMVPQNVWLGVTVENQAMADKRIPELLKIPARVRWLSVEPLLERICLAEGAFSIVGTFRRDIHWVVVGGESGSKRRDCGVEAIVNIAEQCKAAGVPCFVKQASAMRPGQQGRIPDNIWALKQFPGESWGHVWPKERG